MEPVFSWIYYKIKERGSASKYLSNVKKAWGPTVVHTHWNRVYENFINFFTPLIIFFFILYIYQWIAFLIYYMHKKFHLKILCRFDVYQVLKFQTADFWSFLFLFFLFFFHIDQLFFSSYHSCFFLPQLFLPASAVFFRPLFSDDGRKTAIIAI